MMRAVLFAALALLAMPAAAQTAPDLSAEGFRAELTQRVPGATIRVEGPMQLVATPRGRPPLTINLDRIIDFCANNPPADCATMRDRAIASMVEVMTADYTVTRPRLRALVRSADYLSTPGQAREGPAGTVADAVVNRPFAPGIVVLLGADFPTTTQLVSPAVLRDLGLSEAAGLALGIDQVLATMPPLPTIAAMRQGPVAIEGRDYISSIILRPERWAALANSAGGRLAMAVPADNLVVVALVDGGDLPGFAQVIRDLHGRAERRISPLVYRLSPGGLVEAR